VNGERKYEHEFDCDMDLPTADYSLNDGPWPDDYVTIHAFDGIDNTIRRYAEQMAVYANKPNGSALDVSGKNTLEIEAERLEKRAKSLRKQAKSKRRRAIAFGEEPEIGTVFVFEKTYDVREAPFPSARNSVVPVKYMYAAVRTKVGWAISSREAHPMMTYAELIDFIGESPTKVSLDWETVQ
jgi:hypothetical protein